MEIKSEQKQHRRKQQHYHTYRSFSFYSSSLTCCLCDDLFTCLPIKHNYDDNMTRSVNCTHRRLYPPLNNVLMHCAQQYDLVYSLNWFLRWEVNNNNNNQNKFLYKSMNYGEWNGFFFLHITVSIHFIEWSNAVDAITMKYNDVCLKKERQNRRDEQ